MIDVNRLLKSCAISRWPVRLRLSRRCVSSTSRCSRRLSASACRRAVMSLNVAMTAYGADAAASAT